jgi:transposase
MLLHEGARSRSDVTDIDQLALIWADGGYGGQPYRDWVLEHCRWLVEIVKRSDDAQGFAVLPRRWVVDGCRFYPPRQVFGLLVAPQHQGQVH